MQIDLFEFARQGRTASGVVAVAALARIETPEGHASPGSLAWTATGSTRGRHGALRVDLTIDGDVVLTCQRCLKPMTQTLALAPRFLVAADEAEAEAMDQDDEYDVVVGSPTFELDTLIEDEVILALPIAPRHVVCPGGDQVAPVTRPSPFAALAGFKVAGGPPRDGGGEDA